MPRHSVNVKTSNGEHTFDFVLGAATKEISEVLQILGASSHGLTVAEGASQLEKYGPNEIAQEEQHTGLLAQQLTERILGRN
jgi:hypothetical protein